MFRRAVFGLVDMMHEQYRDMSRRYAGVLWCDVGPGDNKPTAPRAGLAAPMLGRGAGLASCRRWAVRSLCTPATPSMSERIQDRIVEYAESAPSKAFDAARKRGGGFGDAIAAMRLKKQQQEKDDAFADNARRLIKLPKFTMAEFRDMLQDSLDKQEAGMTYITKARLKLDTMRGGSTESMIETQKAKVQAQIDIINQMTPCEVDRPALIGYRERERISQVSSPAAEPPMRTPEG